MKKIISFILAVITIFSFSVLSVYSESTTEAKLIEYLQKERNYDPPYYHEFKELFAHDNADGDTDWILIYVDDEEQMPWYVCGVFSHRVISLSHEWGLFSLGLGLYDASEDRFFDLSKIDNYNGLSDAIDLYGVGKLLGDIDNDAEISILDCTKIQRCEAGLCEYPERDQVESYSYKYENIDTPLLYYSDFNRDGERDILDATCIQRYLANMPYTTG